MMQGPNFLNERAALSQIQNRGMVVNNVGYFSRGRFTITRTGASPNYAYTLAQGTEIRLFSYGQGGSMVAAGFASTDAATAVDTSLIKPYTTLAGQDVLIKGVSFLFNTNTDFEFLRVAAPEISVRLGLNGDGETFKLGSILNLPGFGGLDGWGDTQIRTPALAESRTFALLGSNGMPGAANFREFKPGFWWRREGEPDSSLQLTLRAERQVAVTGLADRAAAAGTTAAFNPPASIVVDLVAHLIVEAGGPQSVNR